MKRKKIVSICITMIILGALCVRPTCAKTVGKSDVVKVGSDWYYVKEGKIASGYTGFADNKYGTWYCRGGKVDFHASGVLQGMYGEQSKWGYVSGGKLQKRETIEKNQNGWWYVSSDGFVDFSANTVAKNANGWWVIQNGKVNFDYTGFAENRNGTWYCRGGKVDFSTGGVLKGLYGDQHKWGGVSGGKLQKRETVEKNQNGWWYVSPDGFVDFSANTVAKNANGWWVIQNGKVNFDYTGFAENGNGTWYCQGGKVDFSADGVLKGLYGNQYKWGYVTGGKLQKRENVEKNQNGWWYVSPDGFVDFSANTVAKNANGWWVIQNGKVNFDYTGLFQTQGKQYQISNGSVIQKITEEKKILLKSYYQEEMKKTIDTVEKLQSEPNLVFQLITDIHYMSNAQLPKSIQDSTVNLGYFASAIPSVGIVNLGDNTDGDQRQSETAKRNTYLIQLFEGTGVPYYPCIGNHDDNRYWDLFNLQQIQQIYLPITHGVVSDSITAGTSYYKDFSEYKIRFIWLNANMDGRYGYSDRTVEWLENVALQTEEGYSICVFTHIDPIASHNYGSQPCINGEKVEGLFEEYDKTSGSIIAVFSGHNHVDTAFKSPYLSVISNCQKFENENGDPQLWPQGATKPQRQIGTYTEDCWDVVVIRPEIRKINLVRFGAGEDREFSY